MKHDAGDVVAEAGALGVALDPERAGSLLAYADLLRDTAVPLGLVAEGDRDRIWERHVLDCLRAAAVVGPDDRRAYDLGSGAGLPGLVVAIAVPGLEVTLAEVRSRRVGFLELAVERLALRNVRVHPGRVEDLPPGTDLCFARAFAPPAEAWAAAGPLLGTGGRLVLFAGANEDLDLTADGLEVRLVPAPGGPVAGVGPLAIIRRL